MAINLGKIKGDTQNDYIKNVDGLRLNRNSKNNIYTNNKKVVLPKKKDDDDTLIEKVADGAKYLWNQAKTGFKGGVTGVGTSVTTDVADNLKKGSKKGIAVTALELFKAANEWQNPSEALMKNTIKSLKNLTDKDSNAYEKVVNYALDAASPETIVDKGVQLYGSVLPKSSSDKMLDLTETISKPYNEARQKMAEETAKQGKVMQILGGASAAVGQMLPSIAATMVTKNPSIGMATMGMSAKGNSTTEALEQGAKLEKAVKIGNLKSQVEIGTEMLTGGLNIFGKGSLDDLVEKNIISKARSRIVQELAKRGYNIAGEVVEETISDLVGTTIDKGTINPNADYGIDDWSETALTTVLSTVVLNGLTNGIANGANILTKKSAEQNSNVNLPKSTTNLQEQKYSKSVTAPSTFQYEETNNNKINNLNKSAAQYFNNSDTARKFVDSIGKIVADKGYNVLFDNTITNNSGNQVNAQIKTLANGEVEIRLNPNSDRAGEFLIMHEVTHAIETDAMKKLVMNYASKNSEFNSALESLKQTYGVDDVTSEVLADISGQLFGNQEFINNLSIEQPNIFKRIYNAIISIANKLTGNSKESLFIKDLKNKWENAYRTQENNLNQETEYSIGGIKAINQLSDSKYKQDALDAYSYAQDLAKQNVDNETIRQETKWFQDKNGDWKFEFDDSKLKFKDNINLKENNSYKLSDVIEHNVLFKLYPELKDYNIEFKRKKSNGAFSVDYKTIEINNNLLKKDSQELLGTIIHEIQHAIQHTEGFETGRSSKLSREQYYKSLGEIEADDTKQRFLRNMDKNDRLDKAPKTSLPNPKHRNYDNYMATRSTFDKIRDKAYNQFKGAKINDEIFEKDLSQDKKKSNFVVDERGLLDSSSFSFDNQGRELTKNQQEYFKDSKVRDEKGRLLAVYHGTKNDFTIFDINKAGQSNGLEATAGFWFTENENGAKQFSDEVWYGENENAKAMEVYLNIKNPKVYENIDNTEEINFIKNQQKEISSQLSKYYNKYDINFDFVGRMEPNNTFNNISNYSWASDSELKKAIKEWAKVDNVNEYYNDIKDYKNLLEKKKTLENKLSDLRYTDSYEQFRSDIYKVAGKSPTDANFGGTGMALDNQNQVMSDYIGNLKKQGYDGIIIKGTNYDSNRFGENNNQYVAFNSNQIKNVTNTNPTTDADIRYSKNNNKWEKHLEENYKASGTRTDMQEIAIEQVQKETKEAILPLKKEIKALNDSIKSLKDDLKRDKLLNPNEISNLTPEYANTTPNLPNIKRNKSNDGDSKFFENIREKTDMLNDQQKDAILQEDEVKYYDKVTNKDTLNEAFNKLNKNGKSETQKWFAKDSEKANAVDVAEGWILLKQYADNNDADGMVAVAKKMRDIGTKAGQTIQAFNILERLTPEGMVKYAQTELQEAYDAMVKNKSKEWIDKHKSEFDLKPEEVAFIMEAMKEVSTMEDGYDKRVKLAEIQKIMTDKLPPDKGAGLKAWMRISMLFNPKTQVRNVLGNAIIAPVNTFSDMFASVVDKAMAKKTGTRTTGFTNTKQYLKGFKKGLYESYNDFKKGINTRNISGNRFEIGQGKSFNNNALIGKNLNRVDSLLSFMLDAGDRGFYEAAFTNSINNQMVLNNTTEVSQEMIDIATQEALSRTWQDNNAYSNAVLKIRKLLNGNNAYGLGDVLIPFAKTPANLTKAIVDYSPAGLISTLVKGNNLRKSLNNGQFTAKMQHDFVQSLGKATAGTMLYVLGYALAKSGIISGESDDDKDVKNFLQNTLGISSYSIKIGNKSFQYDWAQPVAAPLSIMANIVNSKDNQETALLEAITSSLDSAGSILLEQSFVQSINDVLSNSDGIVSGLITEILELPARAIPTFSKQIADMIDGTKRTTFEYDQPIKSAINYAKSKIPGLSKTLAPSVDTLGREVQKYGGKNNIFNVFLNPANVNTENISESAEEIYRLYKATGKTDIMPRVAPYYINKDKKTILTSDERTKYQKVSGEIIEANINNLLKLDTYKNLSDESKAEVINDIVNYSYNIAQKEVLGLELSEAYEKAYQYSQIGNISDYYTFKNSIDNTDGDAKKESIKNYLVNSKLNDEQLAFMYGSYYSSEEKLNNLLAMNIPIKEYIKLNSEDISGEYNTKTGTTINGSKKKNVIEYVNSLKLSIPQKAILIKMQYSTYNSYDKQIINYINNIDATANDKKVMLKSIGFDNYNSDVVNYINSQNISASEKEKKLKSLGFTIRNGRVYW